MNFLIDECLPMELVELATKAGHQAAYVPHIGKAGLKDWELAPFAIEKGMVIVTNNSKDFRGNGKKAGFITSEEIHPGLVCLNCENSRRSTKLFVTMFDVAVKEIGGAGDMINTVIEVTQTGDELEVTKYQAPELN